MFFVFIYFKYGHLDIFMGVRPNIMIIVPRRSIWYAFRSNGRSLGRNELKGGRIGAIIGIFLSVNYRFRERKQRTNAYLKSTDRF